MTHQATDAARPFDTESFLAELGELRSRFGVLAISAHVMVPLDAHHHHVLQAQSGVDQVHIDIVEIAARRKAGATR